MAKRYTYEPKSSSMLMASTESFAGSSMPSFSTISFNPNNTKSILSQDDEGTVSTAKDSSEINSVLLIGASGKTGLKCVMQLSQQPPLVYIFSPDIGRLSKFHIRHCEQAIEGEADNCRDLERALDISQADVVVLFSGDEEEEDKDDIRYDLKWIPTIPVVPGVGREGDSSEESKEREATMSNKITKKATAKALTNVLQKKPEFQSTRLMVVDITCCCDQPKRAHKRSSQKMAVPLFSAGKKCSKSNNEMSVEEFSSVTKTHEEEEFAESLSDYASILDRTTIVLPTIKKRTSFKRRRGSIPFTIPKPPPLPFGFHKNKASNRSSSNQMMKEVIEEEGYERSGSSTYSMVSQEDCLCLADWVVREILHGEGNEGRVVKLSNLRV